MGAPRKADWREERRKRAWQVKEQGWQQKDIATALGVSEGAVSQWLKRGRERGVEALNAHPPTGVTPRLTAEQKAQVPELLAKGAEAYGFRGDVWTASRVAQVIAMKRPSRSGHKSAGPRSKKSRAGASHDRLGRRSRLLSLADGRTHVGAPRADASPAGQV